MRTMTKVAVSRSGAAFMLLAGTITLLPGTVTARELTEQQSTAPTPTGPDAEVAAAKDQVRQAEEKVRSKRRAGGVELSQAQEEMVQARETLRAVTNAADQRREQAERRAWLDKIQGEKDREQARQAEQARQVQDRQRQHDEEQRLAKERQQAADKRERAEAMKDIHRMVEEDRRRAQEQREYEEQGERERTNPQNILKRVYASYIQVKRCHASLAGKAFVYIDDRELATARAQTKDIEAQLRRTAPAIDSDAAWRAANETDPTALLLSNGGEDDVEAGVLSQRGQEFCRGALVAVRERYVALNPEAGLVKKDF